MALLTWQNGSDGKNKAHMCALSIRGRRDRKSRQRMQARGEDGMESKDWIMKGFECQD